MPVLQLGPEDGLYYEWEAARDADGLTFVFVNAITGDLGMWEARIGPALRADGHGTLGYNFRGQARSPVPASRALSDRQIVDDLAMLLGKLEPSRPVLVGLSIGGLFAARAHLAGTSCAGLVLINTLRRMGPRLAWLNEAMRRALKVGGPALTRELLTPLLAGEAFLAANREAMLPAGQDYTPPAPDSGIARLIDAMAATDWTLDYSRLSVPVLLLTGLQDRVFHDAVDVASLARTIPDHRRIDLPEAGHLLPAEAPDAVLAALRGFAAELAG
jgi:pimeloyl-ACP methyl ester carboxylesterase